MKKSELAKAIVAFSFRNNETLERIHADGRISQTEMKKLMRAAVNRVYTVLAHEGDAEFEERILNHALAYTRKWDEPVDVAGEILGT